MNKPISKSSNPFLIFMHELRQDLAERGVPMRTTKMARMAAEKWREMSPDEKSRYQMAAYKNKQQKKALATKETRAREEISYIS
uniref:HMG box domain-containing protein n=1 Tax=Stomoxys calcitrans TaxID=35570 RepID=A0A1I8PA23_STOCA